MKDDFTLAEYLLNEYLYWEFISFINEWCYSNKNCRSVVYIIEEKHYIKYFFKQLKIFKIINDDDFKKICTKIDEHNMFISINNYSEPNKFAVFSVVIFYKLNIDLHYSSILNHKYPLIDFNSFKTKCDYIFNNINTITCID